MALILILICCTVVIDKWLLKKQHEVGLRCGRIEREKDTQDQIKRLKKFQEYILDMEKEKEDLINYALKKIKKLT